jgi:hypothetical protein
MYLVYSEERDNNTVTREIDRIERKPALMKLPVNVNLTIIQESLNRSFLTAEGVDRPIHMLHKHPV